MTWSAAGVSRGVFLLPSVFCSDPGLLVCGSMVYGHRRQLAELPSGTGSGVRARTRRLALRSVGRTGGTRLLYFVTATVSFLLFGARHDVDPATSGVVPVLLSDDILYGSEAFTGYERPNGYEYECLPPNGVQRGRRSDISTRGGKKVS